MLLSIFSGIFDRYLGFRCVLHRLYYWMYVRLKYIYVRMVKRTILDPFSSYSQHQNIVHCVNCNLASHYDRNIIPPPC